MSGNIWEPNITRHARYCDDSVSDNDSVISKYILLYSSLRKQKHLKILDVGCSTGSPDRHLAGYLRTHGINPVIDGLDVSIKIKNEAESNLNKFYMGNLFDIYIDPIYDIVICSRLLRFLDPLKQHEGVSKCMLFCNDNGVVITDGVSNTHYAINGYTVFTRDNFNDQKTCQMEDQDSKPWFCKHPTHFPKWVFFKIIGVVVPLYRRYNRKKQSSCFYCNF